VRFEIGSKADVGFIHQQHFGTHGDRTRDAQALLLTAGQTGATLLQLVFDLIPQALFQGPTARDGSALHVQVLIELHSEGDVKR